MNGPLLSSSYRRIPGEKLFFRNHSSTFEYLNHLQKVEFPRILLCLFGAHEAGCVGGRAKWDRLRDTKRKNPCERREKSLKVNFLISLERLIDNFVCLLYFCIPHGVRHPIPSLFSIFLFVSSSRKCAFHYRR